METSTVPPNAPNLTGEQDDALASTVLEIIGGVTFEAFQTVEEPEERDVWSLEEGDDSVFYSDEEQVHQDRKATASCDFSANKCKPLVISGEADKPKEQREDDAGKEVVIKKENSEMEQETAQQVIWTVEKCPKLQTPKTEQMYVSDAEEPAAECDPTIKTLVETCGEIPQPNCTTADMPTQPQQNISAQTENKQHVKEEEVVLEAETQNLEPSDVFKEERSSRLNGKAEVPEQLSSAGLQLLEVDQEVKQDHDLQVHAGFYQNPSPGYSTMPPLKKSGCGATQQKSFNHLSSSKYSTVSYRKIRRGNTRQKIEEFEYMMTNQ